MTARWIPDLPPQPMLSADGYPLFATLFPATGHIKGHIVVAGATGVPQSFYKRFAEFASQQGYTTLTFDYRGIGLSRSGPLEGFEANYLDWGQKDLAAAITTMSCDQTPLYVIGHSFGGHAFGMLPNHADVRGFCVFGTGAAWHGWMPAPERYRIWAAWHLVFPPLVRMKGYLPSRRLGLGSDLPLGVYQQWRRWSQLPHYFFDDPDMAATTARFSEVTTPIRAVNAHDDDWATPQSRDALLKGYANAAITTRDIDPTEGFDDIGHMGYFRSSARALWQESLDWFDSLN